jgi:hypothetical protein
LGGYSKRLIRFGHLVNVVVQAPGAFGSIRLKAFLRKVSVVSGQLPVVKCVRCQAVYSTDSWRRLNDRLAGAIQAKRGIL